MRRKQMTNRMESKRESLGVQNKTLIGNTWGERSRFRASRHPGLARQGTRGGMQDRPTCHEIDIIQ